VKRNRRATASDLRRVLDCIHHAISVPDLDTLTEALANAMPRLLDTEIGGYNEADPGRSRFTTRLSQGVNFPQQSFEVWAAFAHENPLVNHILSHPDDLGVYRFTDFVDQQTFRATSLCAELYTPLRAEHQISMPFPVMDGAAVALTFNRDVDYTEREREILTLAQPCLIAAYRNAQRLTDLRTGHHDLLAWLESTHSPVAVLTLRGRILGASPGILELIERFAADPKRRPDRLPDGVARWWRRAIAAPELGGPVVAPLVLRRDDEALRLTAIRTASGQSGILALQVSKVAHESTGSPLKLTHRELEVFRAIGHGMNNKAIASAFGLSVRTVEKHVENLLNKLGVKSRTAACAIAARMLRNEAPGGQ
jgi:DNA-binding CsgD family transcriptional regulator